MWIAIANIFIAQTIVMPQSRKRSGHHQYRKPSDIPAKQRTKGRTSMAFLFGVFALLIAFFAAGDNYIVLIISVVAGALIGYIVGRIMERDASKKGS
jgi:VIT1/CCC1 family predicted Fe2+/Mn2+ transporter